eukprot:3247989-Pleurochrysis_carterae.AAC.1
MGALGPLRLTSSKEELLPYHTILISELRISSDVLNHALRRERAHWHGMELRRAESAVAQTVNVMSLPSALGRMIVEIETAAAAAKALETCDKLVSKVAAIDRSSSAPPLCENKYAVLKAGSKALEERLLGQPGGRDA